MIVYDSCPNCGDNHIFLTLSAKDYTVSGETFEIWECKNCTLRFTQNVPQKEDIGKYYQSENYISHSDTSTGMINSLYHKIRKRTLIQKKKLVETATGKTAGKILDVGCGTGAFLNVMQKAKWICTGIEPDQQARQKALELYGLKPREPENFYSLPAHSYDAITLWHVLEHVHELHPYMEQLKKLLAPGGRLFIAVPNYTSLDARIYKECWAAYDVPRHLYHFSPGAMKNLLDFHTIRLDAIKPMWYDSVYVSMLSQQYRTGKSNTVKAIINGCFSNLNAVVHKPECSSLIYIASVV
jgi:2-polyprenyl-3-methyl-5-hydroxy-6-metoxy-1,4-benzoquinol methylase